MEALALWLDRTVVVLINAVQLTLQRGVICGPSQHALVHIGPIPCQLLGLTCFHDLHPHRWDGAPCVADSVRFGHAFC